MGKSQRSPLPAPGDSLQATPPFATGASPTTQTQHLHTPHQSHLPGPALFLRTSVQTFLHITGALRVTSQSAAIPEELGGEGSWFKYCCAHGHTLMRHNWGQLRFPSLTQLGAAAGERHQIRCSYECICSITGLANTVPNA